MTVWMERGICIQRIPKVLLGSKLGAKKHLLKRSLANELNLEHWKICKSGQVMRIQLFSTDVSSCSLVQHVQIEEKKVILPMIPRMLSTMVGKTWSDHHPYGQYASWWTESMIAKVNECLSLWMRNARSCIIQTSRMCGILPLECTALRHGNWSHCKINSNEAITANKGNEMVSNASRLMTCPK